MSNPKSIVELRSIQNKATMLKQATTWSELEQPISIENDFIYEMYVLFFLINYLICNEKPDYKHQLHIEYFEGYGDTANKFPKKPARKRDRPKFILGVTEDSFKTTIYEICAGTQIFDIHKKLRTPDISIQLFNGNETPDHINILAIWDAKFRKDNSKRISHHEFSEFGRIIELLNCAEDLPMPIKSALSNDNLDGNCLVTNGIHSTEPDDERTRKSLKEIFKLSPGSIYKIKP